MTEPTAARGFDPIAWITDNLVPNKIPQLTPEQTRCFRVLCSIAQPYNLPLIGRGWHEASTRFDDDYSDTDEPPRLSPINITTSCVIARLHGELATYDGDQLTRLVLAAHHHAVRVAVTSTLYTAIDYEGFVMERDSTSGEWTETDQHPTSTRQCLTVILHARRRDAERSWQRHPHIADAIARLYPLETP